jgi:hypothetical protein
LSHTPSPGTAAFTLAAAAAKVQKKAEASFQADSPAKNIGLGRRLGGNANKQNRLAVLFRPT